jgi:hypothetical protein
MEAAPATDLLTELKALRKGRGVHAPKIGDQVGPALRRLCGVTAEDGAELIRRKVTDRLDALVAKLPEDLALAVRVTMGLRADAQQPFLRERVQWLAERLARDERTARRRADDGLARLAEVAVSASGGVPRLAERADDDWYVEEFWAVFRLDRPAPEALERRRIVAERDGIEQVVAMISLPRDRTDRSASHELLMEVVYGATLIGEEHDTDSQFRFTLQLPAPLRAGERHEYAVHFRVPENQPMRPHYVFTSPRRCDLFELRIRFDRKYLPPQIWRVDGVFHRAVDDAQPSKQMLVPDRAGELHLLFRDLRPGFGYGAQWTKPTSHELQHPAPALAPVWRR